MFRQQHRQYSQYNNKLKLLRINGKSQLPYFFLRKILFSYINSNNKEINSFFLGKSKAKIVTGFGLTGYPHIGTKIIRDELLYFLNKKFSVFVCLSEADALNKCITQKGKNKSLSAINLFFKNIFSNKKCFFVNLQKSKRLMEKNIWSDIVAKKIFKKIFGQIDQSLKEAALFDMAKDILSVSIGLEKDKRCIVILGIDEFNNAVFVSKVAKALKQNVPIFLFNKIVPGYGFSKMGKSIPEKSFIFNSAFAHEYKKSQKYFGKINHREGARCSLCDIVFFSGYKIDLKHKNAIKFIHQNSKSILKNIYKENCGGLN